MNAQPQSEPPPIETRYIRLTEREQYEREGWEVTPIRGFHCQWSHLATREVAHG